MSLISGSRRILLICLILAAGLSQCRRWRPAVGPESPTEWRATNSIGETLGIDGVWVQLMSVKFFKAVGQGEELVEAGDDELFAIITLKWSPEGPLLGETALPPVKLIHYSLGEIPLRQDVVRAFTSLQGNERFLPGPVGPYSHPEAVYCFTLPERVRGRDLKLLVGEEGSAREFKVAE